MAMFKRTGHGSVYILFDTWVENGCRHHLVNTVISRSHQALRIVGFYITFKSKIFQVGY